MRRVAAIIGGGVIGGGWAARFLLNGWELRVFDPDPQAARKIGEVLDNARHALPMLYDVALPDEGRLSFHPTMSEAVAGAEWIQESVPERLPLKRKVFQTIQAHCAPDAVIGSSTSGFKPSDLQGCATRPGQIVVTHPFNPVYLLPLVELVTSPANDAGVIARAQETLSALGLYPLHLTREIDAHIADRLLEAVWREALWLVHDGIATTAEIDDAIRMGFGLRWAQMGLFETYRIAGGEAGMKHFIDQFGPALAWPWTKLMDVPEMTDDLAQRIADQSDAQSGDLSIRELERKRDGNLVAILRALRQRDDAAGRLINRHQAGLGPAPDARRRVIPADWADARGVMQDGRFGQLFGEAVAAVLRDLEQDAGGACGHVITESRVQIRVAPQAGDSVSVETRLDRRPEGALTCAQELRRVADGALLATAEQVLAHVDLETRAPCAPDPEMAARIAAWVARSEPSEHVCQDR